MDSMDVDIERTPRVNSARMGDFVGRTVRLVCKVTRVRSYLISFLVSNFFANVYPLKLFAYRHSRSCWLVGLLG